MTVRALIVNYGREDVITGIEPRFGVQGKVCANNSIFFVFCGSINLDLYDMAVGCRYWCWRKRFVRQNIVFISIWNC